MADNKDWVKLYRALLSDVLWQTSTPEQKVVLITLLLMVNHKENEWEWNGRKFKCMPGQVVTSLESIKKTCGEGVSIRNIRTALVRLEKYDFLTNETTKQGRLITIRKWGKYQTQPLQTDKASDNQVTNDRQTGDKRVTTNKNDKKVKNEKNNIYAELPPALVSALLDFEEMRKKKRNPMTDRARELLLKRLNKLSGGDVEECVALLEESTEKGWTSVYPKKQEKGEDRTFIGILSEYEDE